jgi:hypothetical protein
VNVESNQEKFCDTPILHFIIFILCIIKNKQTVTMKIALVIGATFLCTTSRAFVRFSVPSTSRRQSKSISKSDENNNNNNNNAVVIIKDRGSESTTHRRRCPSYLNAADIFVDISNDSDDKTEHSDELFSSRLPSEMLDFPRHAKGTINEILIETENLVQNLHKDSKAIDPKKTKRSMSPMVNSHDSIFANTYVDLGNIDTVGFDYDYTLVHYTEELLTLLYEMALSRLVEDRHYPTEMMECGLHYDPYFSIRGG